MQGFSSDFSTTVQKPHVAVVSAQVIQNGKVVVNLEPHAGSVTADRTQAQMRTMQFECIDRDGTLAPTSMTSILAPFGSRVLLRRGVRIRNVTTQTATYDVENPWSGQLVSVRVSPDGGLTLNSA